MEIDEDGLGLMDLGTNGWNHNQGNKVNVPWIRGYWVILNQVGESN